MKIHNPLTQLASDFPTIENGPRGHSFFSYVHVSLKHRYVYVETPKTGCSSIKSLLRKAELGNIDQPLQGEYIHMRKFSPLLAPEQIGSLKKLLVGPDKFFVFCVVRNPFTRLLSAYLDQIVRNKPPKRKIIHALNIPDALLYDALSFDDFVDAILQNPEEAFDSHWAIQAQHLHIGLINYDFIGRFEMLEQDMSKVMHALGINQRLTQHGREQTHASSLLKKYFSKSTAQKVLEIFKSDFEYLGYSKNLDDIEVATRAADIP